MEEDDAVIQSRTGSGPTAEPNTGWELIKLLFPAGTERRILSSNRVVCRNICSIHKGIIESHYLFISYYSCWFLRKTQSSNSTKM